MDFALVYIAHRFIYRVFDFFHHWYVDGSRMFLARFLVVFAGLERSLALGTTLAHFFEPLYKDYSTVGRALGISFRAGRIALGGVFYALFIAAFVVAYAAWLVLPPATLLLASQNIPPSALMDGGLGLGKAVFGWVASLLKPPALPGELSLP
jgi:hypothetical protein